MEIMTIKNVNAYIKDDIAYLKLEDVARGLGFEKTDIKDENEYKSIRWERVFGYLEEFSFDHKWAKNGFIPENIFYKLCMKANNKIARKFQDLVCDEILPTIRKHGAYLTNEKIEEVLTNPDTIIKLATELKKERAEKQKALEQIEKDKPKVIFATAVEASATSALIGDFVKALCDNDVKVGRNRVFKWLRDSKYLMKNNVPYQQWVEKGYFEVIPQVIVTPKGNKERFTTKITAKGQVALSPKILETFKVA